MNSDFQINREYLDTKFQGYKLNTAHLPVHSQHLAEGLYVVQPSDDQYSFLQQREFSLHNHLHSDPWDPFSVYVVTSERKIKRISVHGSEISGGISGVYEVWEISFSAEGVSRHANVSICFASAEVVVVSDGGGSLHILATGDRKLVPGLWKELHCEKLQDSIRLADARCVSPTELHCLCCRVDTKHTYIIHLYLTSNENNNWKLERAATLFGKGSVDYAALDFHCQTAYVIGQIEAKTQEFLDEEHNKPTNPPKEISYEWQQNFEEIKLWVSISEGSKPTISTTLSEVQVKAQDGRILLQGILYRPIDAELTTWKVVERSGISKFEITLSKKDEGSMWPQAFESSEFHGSEVPDAELSADIHTMLAHLTSETEDVGGATVLNSGQLEECDISDGEGRLLVQYDLSSSLASPINKIDLGNGQWLMSGPRRMNHPPKFCLRFDVDGIVWEIKNKLLQHSATLCAYGFVQASKSSRVFSFLPSDASYCGLVDSEGRVFIYQDGVRPGNNREWGSQQIITIGKSKIQGVHATSSNLFVLSENYLYVIQIYGPSNNIV